MDVATDHVATVAAFLSGVGSVLTGFLALRYESKRSRQACEERIAALHEGIRLRDEYAKKPDA